MNFPSKMWIRISSEVQMDRSELLKGTTERQILQQNLCILLQKKIRLLNCQANLMLLETLETFSPSEPQSQQALKLLVSKYNLLKSFTPQTSKHMPNYPPLVTSTFSRKTHSQIQRLNSILLKWSLAIRAAVPNRLKPRFLKTLKSHPRQSTNQTM